MGSDAIGVFYNYSATLGCYDYSAAVNPDTDEDGTFWDYQYCTENTMPFSKNGGACRQQTMAAQARVSGNVLICKAWEYQAALPDLANGAGCRSRQWRHWLLGTWCI